MQIPVPQELEFKLGENYYRATVEMILSEAPDLAECDKCKDLIPANRKSIQEWNCSKVDEVRVERVEDIGKMTPPLEKDSAEFKEVQKHLEQQLVGKSFCSNRDNCLFELSDGHLDSDA